MNKYARIYIEKMAGYGFIKTIANAIGTQVNKGPALQEQPQVDSGIKMPTMPTANTQVGPKIQGTKPMVDIHRDFAKHPTAMADGSSARAQYDLHGVGGKG